MIERVSEGPSIGVELQFLVVYIAEAHAEDEWPVASARYNFGDEVHVTQTCTTASRCTRAGDFFARFNYDANLWILTLAQPEDEMGVGFGYGFEAIFKPWPFRAFGFVNNTLDMISEPHACETRISELRHWLDEKLAQHVQPSSDD